MSNPVYKVLNAVESAQQKKKRFTFSSHIPIRQSKMSYLEHLTSALNGPYQKVLFLTSLLILLD